MMNTKDSGVVGGHLKLTVISSAYHTMISKDTIHQLASLGSNIAT